MIYEEKLISQKPKWLLENSLKMSVKGKRWGWCEGQDQFSGLSPRDGLGRGGRDVRAGIGTLAETERGAGPCSWNLSCGDKGSKGWLRCAIRWRARLKPEGLVRIEEGEWNRFQVRWTAGKWECGEEASGHMHA